MTVVPRSDGKLDVYETGYGGLRHVGTFTVAEYRAHFRRAA